MREEPECDGETKDNSNEDWKSQWAHNIKLTKKMIQYINATSVL